MLGRPTDLDNGKARACCACTCAGRSCLVSSSIVYHFSFFSLAREDGAI